jgi:hypothetical protein
MLIVIFLSLAEAHRPREPGFTGSFQADALAATLSFRFGAHNSSAHCSTGHGQPQSAAGLASLGASLNDLSHFLRFVQKQVPNRRRSSNNLTLTLTVSPPTGEGTARPILCSFQSGWIRSRPGHDSLSHPYLFSVLTNNWPGARDLSRTGVWTFRGPLWPSFVGNFVGNFVDSLVRPGRNAQP